LLALAHHFDRLIREGVVEDYADIARLGGVSRARISQLVGLLDLAPDIQEQLLLRRSTQGSRAHPSERSLRPITAEPDWDRQREFWSRIRTFG
jgi:hypothetical protein